VKYFYSYACLHPLLLLGQAWS